MGGETGRSINCSQFVVVLFIHLIRMLSIISMSSTGYPASSGHGYRYQHIYIYIYDRAAMTFVSG